MNRTYKSMVFTIVITMFLLIGCAPQTIIQNQLDGVFNSLVKVYQEETDIELVRSAFPFNLKTLDALADQNSTNPNMLLAAASAYTMFTFGFIMEDADRTFQKDIYQGMKHYDRALVLFLRSRNYANNCLELKHSGWKVALESRNISNINLKKEDVPAVYWLAASIGGTVSASRGAPAYLIDLPLVGLLLEKAIDLDPEWNGGSLYAAMISYTMSRPDADPNADQIAMDYFTKANTISNGLDCSYYLSLAEKIYLKRQEKDKFIETLNKVMAINIELNPSLKLSNTLAQNRAEWLLTRVDDLFY